MTTHTPRDSVYVTLFEHLVTNAEGTMPTGAIVPELIEAVGADGETVRDVLRTLEDAGVLVERTERGHLSEPAETCTVYYTDPEGPLGGVGAIPPEPDIHEEYDEETLETIAEELGL
jgi:hypothetical protein